MRPDVSNEMSMAADAIGDINVLAMALDTVLVNGHVIPNVAEHLTRFLKVSFLKENKYEVGYEAPFSLARVDNNKFAVIKYLLSIYVL